MKTESLTIDRLKQMLAYDAETGIFTWVANGRGIKINTRAGSVDKKGYRIIVIDGVQHLAQRLAWFWVYGEWPKLLRFQNGDRDDCRIGNLREGFYLTSKYDLNTKEGRSASQKEYRSLRREMFQQKERERKFGLSLADYSAMVLAQNNKCAICNCSETSTRHGRVKALAIDHCHKTGKIRGLLCSDCNQAIGKFKENRDSLLSAVRYLDKHLDRIPVVEIFSVRKEA